MKKAKSEEKSKSYDQFSRKTVRNIFPHIRKYNSIACIIALNITE